MQKDYGDAHTYMIEIAEKYDKVKTKIHEIGYPQDDTSGDTAQAHMNIEVMLIT